LCEDRDSYVFHVVSTDDELERKRLDRHYDKRWAEVPTAGTVGVVAILLCRMLGFRFQHLFGVDSCYPDDKSEYHHAYPQAWNDAEGCADFWVAGRNFRCSAWQAAQVKNFVDLIKVYGNEVSLSIHGDGVLAHILKAGAEDFQLIEGAAE
jgi:hypothetical protein